MEEKQKGKISLTTYVIGLIALVVVIAIIMFMLYKEKDNNKIQKEEEKTMNIVENKNEQNTYSTQKENKTNSVISSTNTAEKENKVETQNEDSIIGKWHTKEVSNNKGEDINFMSIFGSGYAEYGSSLELKEDNTFIDGIYPIQSSEFSTEGTYRVLNDYKKLGDCYIELKYSDGKTVMAQIVYYDDSNTKWLVLDDEDYSYKLKK